MRRINGRHEWLNRGVERVGAPVVIGFAAEAGSFGSGNLSAEAGSFGNGGEYVELSKVWYARF